MTCKTKSPPLWLPEPSDAAATPAHAVEVLAFDELPALWLGLFRRDRSAHRFFTPAARRRAFAKLVVQSNISLTVDGRYAEAAALAANPAALATALSCNNHSRSDESISQMSRHRTPPETVRACW